MHAHGVLKHTRACHREAFKCHVVFIRTVKVSFTAGRGHEEKQLRIYCFLSSMRSAYKSAYIHISLVEYL